MKINSQIILYFLIIYLLSCNSSTEHNKNENQRLQEPSLISEKDSLLNKGYFIFNGYKSIIKDTLRYSEIAISRDLLNNKLMNNYYIYLINDRYKIYSIVSKQREKSTKKHYEEFIEILGQRFNIDSLFLSSININRLHGEEYLNVIRGFEFALKEKNYIILYLVINDVPTSNYEDYYVLLFDITDQRQILPYPISDQSCFDMNCFNDLNKDQNLDFINFSYNSTSDSITIYTIRKNAFEKINDKFLIIDAPGPLININKSKWFFDLKKLQN